MNGWRWPVFRQPDDAGSEERCSKAKKAVLRAYRACGFVEEGRLREHVWSGSDGKYVDAVYMGVLRAEWNPQMTQIKNV